MKIILALIVTVLLGSQAPVHINNQQPTQLAIVENQQVTEPTVVNPIPNEPTALETPPATVAETVQEIKSPSFTCGDNQLAYEIYMGESTCQIDIVNSIGACGIGQSLPCDKLSSVCPNWRSDYECQNRFFTDYAMQYG